MSDISFERNKESKRKAWLTSSSSELAQTFLQALTDLLSGLLILRKMKHIRLVMSKSYTNMKTTHDIVAGFRSSRLDTFIDPIAAGTAGVVGRVVVVVRRTVRIVRGRSIAIVVAGLVVVRGPIGVVRRTVVVVVALVVRGPVGVVRRTVVVVVALVVVRGPVRVVRRTVGVVVALVVWRPVRIVILTWRFVVGSIGVIVVVRGTVGVGRTIWVVVVRGAVGVRTVVVVVVAAVLVRAVAIVVRRAIVVVVWARVVVRVWVVVRARVVARAIGVVTGRSIGVRVGRTVVGRPVRVRVILARAIAVVVVVGHDGKLVILCEVALK
jgi:hypothetical protein